MNLSSTSSHEDFEVRLQNPRHMADVAEVQDFFGCADPCQERIPKRTNRSWKAELASVLEEVRHGLRHAIDAHGHAEVGVVLDAFGERGPGETDDVERWLLPARAPCLLPDGQKHLRRFLTKQAMEVERRREAHHSLRHTLGGHGRPAEGPICSTPDARSHFSEFDPEAWTRNAMRFHVPKP
ncbi:hypothetical protein [Hyalangium minutum]|uniref:hypothetical protein n=1 Tax=Hyalangium minutum TaxID=394096 RepID=UPI0012FA2FCB|nr:hypothetical protein [Hyalangium minutum]